MSKNENFEQTGSSYSQKFACSEKSLTTDLKLGKDIEQKLEMTRKVIISTFAYFFDCYYQSFISRKETRKCLD